MDQHKIGVFLKELRKEKNLTQEQFAQQLNVSGRTVSRWETGTNMPDISLLAEIASFYNVSIPEIIDGERKNEEMNGEINTVADKMSEYAAAEKEEMIKSVRIHSLMGSAGLAVLFILETALPETQNGLINLIKIYCMTLAAVSLFIIAVQSTGMLNRIRRRDRESTMPKPVLYVAGAAAAFAAAWLISFLLKLITG